MFSFQKFYLLFMATSSVIFGLETVNELDLNKYSGRWYQVYGNKFDLTFQGRSKCITADYTIVPDKNVSVLNSQYTLNDELEQIEGFAYYSDNVNSKEEPGKLTVHLDGVPRDSPYWVLNIGSEVDGYYDWAIVSDPFGLSLFVLARNVDRYYDNYDDYVLTLLKDYGFDNPIQIEQDNCDYVQEPTNEIYLQTNKQTECQVASYLRKAGFPENTIGTMVCISKYESSFNCDATNKNTDSSTDYGLFQINSYYWCSGDPMSKYNECHTSCSSLFNCQTNANCAYTVWRQQGYTAWYGYQYHKSECDNYKVNC